MPVVVLANGRWRPMLACAAAVAVLAGAATLAFGWRAWWLFLTVAQPEAHRQLVAPFGAEYQLADYSMFMMARSLGSGVAGAWAAQGLGAAGAAVGVWALWRAPAGDEVRRAFLTVCCTMLAVPFGFSYDLMGFSVLAAAMLPRTPPARWPMLVALWLWPGLTILITMRTHIVLLPLVALMGILLAGKLPPALTVPAALANPRRVFD